MAPFDLKNAIFEDIKEIDLVLTVLNSMRDTNLVRLTLIYESEKRS